MAKTRKVRDHRDYDDEEQSTKRKHTRHASNRKGEGMRVINSWVEEDIDFNDDYIDDEDEVDETSFSKTKQTYTHKLIL
jgi:hypothetical protein